jgi:hypothetical protein
MTTLQTVYTDEIEEFEHFNELFNGEKMFWIENRWCKPVRGAPNLPPSNKWLEVKRNTFGFYAAAPKIMYSPNKTTPFVKSYVIGCLRSFKPENFVSCWCVRPFSDSYEELSGKNRHKLQFNFDDPTNVAMNKINKLSYQLTTGIQMFCIAETLDIDMIPFLEISNNIEFLTKFLTEISEKVSAIDPKKTAANKDDIATLTDLDYISFIAETFETNSLEGIPIHFMSVNGTQRICNQLGEECGWKDKDPPYFMFGRLVQQACNKLSVHSKINKPLSWVFKESHVPGLPINKSFYKTKDGTLKDSFGAVLECIFKLSQSDKGYNDRMNNVITTIVPIKNNKKVFKGQPQLNLEIADRFLWGTKKKADQKYCSLHHEAAIFIIPEINLGFYKQGAPSLKFRVAKLVVIPRTTPTQVLIKSGEDELFGSDNGQGGSSDEYEHEETHDEETIDVNATVSF